MMQQSSSTESPAQPVWMLAAGARYNGTYILGAKGSGKSTLEAALAWQDYLRGIGQIIIDPIGVGLTWSASNTSILRRKTISCPFR
jgi:ABC-type lipoprotein export system ATPase subunit